MNTLTYAIDFWSKGKMRAYFLRHEGFLGAVGAFLKRQPQNWGRRSSNDPAIENFDYNSFRKDFGNKIRLEDDISIEN